jgi:hypothetical protein
VDTVQATVPELKARIASVSQPSVPVDHQRLIYKGRVLLDSKPLSYYRMWLYIRNAAFRQLTDGCVYMCVTIAEVAEGDTLHLISRDPTVKASAVGTFPYRSPMYGGRILSASPAWWLIGGSADSQAAAQDRPQPQQSAAAANPMNFPAPKYVASGDAPTACSD